MINSLADSTDKVMSNFTTLVDRLKAVAAKAREKANTTHTKGLELLKQSDVHEAEASRAEEAAETIQDVFKL